MKTTALLSAVVALAALSQSAFAKIKTEVVEKKRIRRTAADRTITNEAAL